jgi:hypothetical protein
MVGPRFAFASISSLLQLLSSPQSSSSSSSATTTTSTTTISVGRQTVREREREVSALLLVLVLVLCLSLHHQQPLGPGTTSAAFVPLIGSTSSHTGSSCERCSTPTHHSSTSSLPFCWLVRCLAFFGVSLGSFRYIISRSNSRLIELGGDREREIGSSETGSDGVGEPPACCTTTTTTTTSTTCPFIIHHHHHHLLLSSPLLGRPCGGALVGVGCLCCVRSLLLSIRCGGHLHHHQHHGHGKSIFYYYCYSGGRSGAGAIQGAADVSPGLSHSV